MRSVSAMGTRADLLESRIKGVVMSIFMQRCMHHQDQQERQAARLPKHRKKHKLSEDLVESVEDCLGAEFFWVGLA